MSYLIVKMSFKKLWKNHFCYRDTMYFKIQGEFRVRLAVCMYVQSFSHETPPPKILKIKDAAHENKEKKATKYCDATGLHDISPT